MNRGEIWDAEVGGRAGKRPVLILTRSMVIPYLTSVVVVEITTQGKGYPTQVEIGQAGNLAKHSYVSTDNLYTLSKESMRRFIGELSDELMAEVSRAVVYALDLGSAVLPPDFTSEA